MGDKLQVISNTIIIIIIIIIIILMTSKKKYFRVRGNLEPIDTLLKSLLSPANKLERKYLFFDLYSPQGCRVMEECTEDEDDGEDTQQFGSNVITNISELSRQSSRALGYLMKAKESLNKQTKVRSMIKEEFAKSLKKFEKSVLIPGKYLAHGESARQEAVYRGMNPEVMQRMELAERYNTIDTDLRLRERKLLHASFAKHRLAKQADMQQECLRLPSLSKKRCERKPVSTRNRK